jgi:hypothetical protein
MRVLTERQTKLMRRLYTAKVELDEVSRGYVGVILACLDTIDALRKDTANDGPEVDLIKFFNEFPQGACASPYLSTPFDTWKRICALRQS